jgi:transcriptional regulator with GAF, ATPase, and Fis domain
VSRSPGNHWNDDRETRPLLGRTVYSLPACSLKVEGLTEPVLLLRNRFTLGSDPANDVVVAADTVSRFHAEILRQGDSLVVRDLDSTNGTFVNGVRVKEAFLQPGAVLALGEARVELTRESRELRVTPSASSKLGGLVGISAPMRQLFRLIELVAPTDATVLVEGETGTGKEVVARTIHDCSRRAEAPFVVIDCSAIPPSLMESELFGHEKGSFSGALSGRKGLFETAHRGTVFLDEVGELPHELQPKLLRVLETGEVRRIGSNRPMRLDVRVVAATNRNLQAEAARGRFRQDLFFRLNVVPLRLPPLRERLEDLEPLVEHFLASERLRHGGRIGSARNGEGGEDGGGEGGGGRGSGREGSGGDREGRPSQPWIPQALLDRWKRHDFPGNVRELFNLVERELSVRSGIEPARIGDDGTPAKPLGPLSDFKQAKDVAVREFEEEYLVRLMEQAQGNISLAARVSGLDRKHLRHLLKKYNLYYTD